MEFQKRKTAMAMAATSLLLISACGGGNADGGVPTESAAGTKRAIQAAGGMVKVVARGSLAANFGPWMEVRVDGKPIGALEVRAATYQTYSFSTPQPLSAGAKVDVVFVNDAVINGQDRNLYVQSVTMDSQQVASTAAGVTYDRGAVDGIDVIPGREDMLWKGALRFVKANTPGIQIPTTGFHPGLSGPVVYDTTEQAPFSNDGTGNFRTVCEAVRMDFVDPIVFPGQKGASHLHTFFGNTAVNESSTPDSLRASGNSACRGGTINRTAYWVPSMIDTRTNTALIPHGSDFYYKSAYLGVQPQDVQPMPAGLRMIAGNPANTDPSYGPTSGFMFSCHNANTQRGSTIPNCDVGDEVDQTIVFPQCWNGHDLDSPDHRSHMAYSTPTGCPSSHPVALPEVTYHIKYQVTEANQATYWKLSSDREGVPRGYSSHGDWMNGWDTQIQKTWTERCINPGKDCHSHLLGDGRAMGGI